MQVTFPNGPARELCKTLSNPRQLGAATHDSEDGTVLLDLYLFVLLMVERPTCEPQGLNDLRNAPFLCADDFLELSGFESAHGSPAFFVYL